MICCGYVVDGNDLLAFNLAHVCNLINSTLLEGLLAATGNLFNEHRSLRSTEMTQDKGLRLTKSGFRPALRTSLTARCVGLVF